MKALNLMVDWLVKLIMGLSSIVVFVLTFAQVLCRFVFKSPLPWSTDILRLAFTYLVFWGAAWCVKEKGHLNIDVVLSSLPEKIRKKVEILISCILIFFFVLLIVQGYGFAMSGLTQTTSYLPIPMAIYYASIPTAAFLMLFYMLQILGGQLKNYRGNEEKSI